MLTAILAQAEQFPWDKLITLSGGAAWAVVAWLFISDKIRPASSCQREIDNWRGIAAQETARANHSEQVMMELLGVARKGVEVAETLQKKAS